MYNIVKWHNLKEIKEKLFHVSDSGSYRAMQCTFYHSTTLTVQLDYYLILQNCRIKSLRELDVKLHEPAELSTSPVDRSGPLLPLVLKAGKRVSEWGA